MMRKPYSFQISTASAFLLACNFSLSAAQAPVFVNVTFHGKVTFDGTSSYNYNYSFINPISNTTSAQIIIVDVSLTDNSRISSITNDNPGWASMIDKKHVTAIWGSGDVLQTGPGKKTTGLHLISTAPPQIRNASISPDLTDYLHQIGREKHIELNLPDNEEYINYPLQLEIKNRYKLSYQVLGPLSVRPGSYAHWDQVWEDIQTAQTLGWLNEPNLINTITTHFGAARAASRAQNGFISQQELQIVIDAIQASTPAQRTDEGYALVYYNALYLIQPGITPYPCEPVLTLAPATGTHPIGDNHTVTASFINRVDGLPIALSDLHVEITGGPNAGNVLEGQTSDTGALSYSYSSTRVGTDTLFVRTPFGYLTGKNRDTRSKLRLAAKGVTTGPSPGCINVVEVKSNPVNVTWTGGPDLLISVFAPALLISAPGRTFYITDTTRNQGVLPASQSVTRYYLSTTQTIDLTTARVIGQRIVAPLAPQESSGVFEVPFTVPSDLPSGTYYLTACADADAQILETDEDNNCAHNFRIPYRHHAAKTRQPPTRGQ